MKLWIEWDGCGYYIHSKEPTHYQDRSRGTKYSRALGDSETVPDIEWPFALDENKFFGLEELNSLERGQVLEIELDVEVLNLWQYYRGDGRSLVGEED